jgi:hypothetical protein
MLNVGPSESEREEDNYRVREALLDRLLNDPTVPLDSRQVWVLLNEITGQASEGET